MIFIKGDFIQPPQPKVFKNSARFLRITSDPSELLDDSHIYPDLYDLAHKYSRNTPDMDDALSSHKYFLMQLIKRENRNPFGDRRRDFEIPTVDQVFEMITKETKDSLYQGLIVSVVVKSVTPNALIVCLKNSGFECEISLDYVDNDVSNIKEGVMLDAYVKSIHEENIAITLSCKSSDLSMGLNRNRSLYYQPQIEGTFCLKSHYLP